MADNNPLAFLNNASGFFFAGNNNDPRVNQALRQRIALAMMSRATKYPKNVGEGLSAIGEAIGDRGLTGQLMQGDLAQQDQAKGLIPPTDGAPAPVTAPPATAPNAYAPPTSVSPPVAAINNSITPPPPPAPLDPASQPPPDLVTAPAQPASMLSPDMPASIQPVDATPLSQAVNPKPMLSQADAPVDPNQVNPLDQNIDPRFGRRRAIAGIESGGERDPYGSRGAITRTGDRAYGRYQVMGANIPSWTQAALGRSLTPAQFLADRDAQDAVFDNRFGGYADKYGEEGAAKAWYAGEKGMQNPDATDLHGRLTVRGYGQDYLNRLQGRDKVAAAMVDQGSTPPVMAAGGDEPPPTTVAQAIQPAPPAQPPIKPQPPPSTTPPAQYDYVMPKPAEVKPPVATPIGKLEAWAIQQKDANQNNPYVQQNMDRIIQVEAAKRAVADKVTNEKFTADQNQANALEQRRQEQIATQAKRGAEGQKLASDAEIYRRTGQSPEQFYPEMDKQRASVEQTYKAQDAQRLARQAIKEGVITGYGANMKIAGAKFADFAFRNGMSGDMAANTETMSAALKAGLSEAVKTVNGEGGTGVSNTDVRIAEGIAGSDPQLQMKTIQRIMDRAAEINHRKIDTYESKVEKYLTGHPQELNYTVPSRQMATPDQVKGFIDARQSDPAKADRMREAFDSKFGPGASDLAVAQYNRAQRRRKD